MKRISRNVLIAMSVLSILLVPFFSEVASASSSPPPQSIGVEILNENKQIVSGAIIQGFMMGPPILTPGVHAGSGGFVSVFKGKTNSNGLFSTQNLTELKKLSSEWINFVGKNTAELMRPNILVFVTYPTQNGTYFTQTSLGININGVMNGTSYLGKGTIFENDKAVIPARAHDEHTLITASTVTPSYSLPCPPATGYCCYWVSCPSTVVQYNGNIPVTNVQTYGNAYATLTSTFEESSSEYYTVGYEIGGGGVSTSFETGGTIGSSQIALQRSYTIPIGQTGQGYIYLCGQVTGEKFAEYAGCGYNTGTTQYDVGLTSVGGMSEASGTPGDCSYVQDNYSSQIYQQASGNGNPNPCWPVQSNQIVNSYSQADTTWVSVALDIGAILVWAAGPEVAIPADIALSLSGSVGTSDSSTSLSEVQYDASSGYQAILEVMVGNVNYIFANNGKTGNIALFSVTAYSQLDCTA